LTGASHPQPHRTKVPLEKALAKLTHLPLNEKGYTRIRNLKQCTAVRVLYLYDNRIERIEGLDFGNTLTHLYLQVRRLPTRGRQALTCVSCVSPSPGQLMEVCEVCVWRTGRGRAQNNEIEVLENLPLKKLQKLYVEGNRISCVPLVHPTPPHRPLTPPTALTTRGGARRRTCTRLVKGLDDCERLEELHISKQRLDPLGPGLQFDPMCMRHIANSLCVLKAQVSSCVIAVYAPSHSTSTHAPAASGLHRRLSRATF